MSTVVSGSAPVRSLSFAGAAPWQALTALFLAVAFAVGVAMPLPDVTWLLIAADRVLHGQQLYTQVLEVNPPLSVLLYMAPAWLGDLTGIDPQTLTAGFCILGIVGSLMLSAAILRPLMGEDRARSWKLVAAAAFVLCILPVAAFAQREHIAVMALLPFLAICLVRADGRRPSWPLAIVAGLGLGLAVAIKPHFAAAAALPALWTCYRTRSFRPWAWPELWIAAGVDGAYLLVVLNLFPKFVTDFLPVARETYVPIRSPFWLLLILPGIPLALGSALVARLTRLEARWVAAPMLAALGGSAAFLVQGKGWPYHAYPMLAFAALGLLGAAVMAPQAISRAWTRIDRAMLLVPSLAAMAWLSSDVYPGAVDRAIAAVAPPSPKIITLSGLGMPLVRSLHGTWAGSGPSQWISEGALRREDAGGLSPGERARLDGLIAQDQRQTAQDIARNRPDVILFTRQKFDWRRQWAEQDPAIVRELAAYRLAAVQDKDEIWVRKAR